MVWQPKSSNPVSHRCVGTFEVAPSELFLLPSALRNKLHSTSESMRWDPADEPDSSIFRRRTATRPRQWFDVEGWSLGASFRFRPARARGVAGSVDCGVRQ